MQPSEDATWWSYLGQVSQYMKCNAILSPECSVCLLSSVSPPISKNGGQRIPPACDSECYTWLLKANTTTELKECIQYIKQYASVIIQ